MISETTTTFADSTSVEQAYRYCFELANRHYENFPVASLLLPARLRRPVVAIYAFARTADDIADEGKATAEDRLRGLAECAAKLAQAAAGDGGNDPIFVALADTLQRHALPVELFEDLLSAFAQDVTRKRYADSAELLDYCRRSANPVGRLLLHLHDVATPDRLARSDLICSALQLINFWQDLAQDYEENDRIYLPAADMARFGVEPTHLEERRNDEPMRQLMHYQFARARRMMLDGAPLGHQLRGRFGLEIRLIIAGGLRVLDRLEAAPDLFARPRLTRADKLRVLRQALFARSLYASM